MIVASDRQSSPLPQGLATSTMTRMVILVKPMLVLWSSEGELKPQRSPPGDALYRRVVLALLLLMALRASTPAQALSLPSITTTRTSSIATTTRSAFLSSSVASSLWWWGTTVSGAVVVALGEPQECQAASPSSSLSSTPEFPRYLDQEVDFPRPPGPDGSPRTSKVVVRRLTGDATPYQFPVREIPLRKVWPDVKDDDKDENPPFRRRDFFRTDNSDDTWFYETPRLVYHIDEPAVSALTQYYRRTIPKGSSILDVCASWVSHYPREFPHTMRKICATGISATELAFNDQVLSDCTVQRDLNVDPTLPYPDASFDVVTLVVSIDYLIHPLEVLREVHRILKPGGQVLVSQSNRCFPTKAIALWLELNDVERLELIDEYFHYAGGFVTPRRAYDITAVVPDVDATQHDPMYVVRAVKA